MTVHISNQERIRLVKLVKEVSKELNGMSTLELIQRLDKIDPTEFYGSHINSKDLLDLIQKVKM